MEKSLVFNINGTGLNVDLVGIIGSTLMAIVVFAICYALSRKVEMKPNKKQNVLEYLIDFTDGIVKDNVEDPAAQKHLSLYAFVLFLFIFCMNQLGLFLEVKVGDYMVIKSPTADPVTTMSFAMMTLLLSFTFGIQKFGTKGYLQNYARPVGFLLPINIIEEFTNFLTLSLRLYGNIFAGEVLLTLIGNQLGPSMGIVTRILVAPLAMIWQGFSVFIGSIQAYVFVTLSMVYIGKKVTQE
ncbi:F0F1 ATP synthase subunit A [Lactobacillus delbrueckii]|uniref:F0F1 ATP synthase subunit A n=1 Tax=Lactobacillus delbrueckii TaxID=1584 RepID=UPI000230E652|nr:F0F1 ATP synthase subunit A [Lactobacillus delbrueckii]EHE90827.1 H(+)-transporting two-sector ATPase [Lactobacillus delbrueckii subsp. bulgaricus CNCM I-1632]MBS4914442.1 F0F1 ATP synthase subunit A [Lactobacillus delbrueckii]MCD5464967.1 F0F1 ATP synthase subunit A [Lactobacillus delbrueckii subsp. bulgaricus]MCT3467258.1 F0F1 ATP synthase subunit A [Lactobacillus delbrueckii subsp. bulgaricus]MCT3475215.1 F0F1 ATP synthase subunit A [Lactobacillus delbrueckii subsp. bulgaricus]